MGLRRSVQGEKSKTAKKGWGGGYKDEFRTPKAEATPIIQE